MGVHGMSADAGFTTPNLLEAETDEALIASAGRVVVVADHTKWGVRGLVSIARLEDADVLVSDGGLSAGGAGDPRGASRRARDRVRRAPAGPVADVEDGSSGGRARRAPPTVGPSYARTSTRGCAPTSSARARRARTCPTPAARSARAAWRRPSSTTCAGSANRWPAMADDRCEVVLYTPEHDATFWSLGAAGARKVVDLWAERSAALGARPDIAYVLVFENRGAEVGATIAHPHGQIYAFDFVPELPLRELERGERVRRARRPPRRDRARLARLGSRGADLPVRADARTGRAASRISRRSTAPAATGSRCSSSTCCERLDRLFDAQTPYMLWIHQRPFDGGDWPQARLHVEIVSPWRAPGVPRFVAAGELGSGRLLQPGRARGGCAVAPRSASGERPGARRAPLPGRADGAGRTPS